MQSGNSRDVHFHREGTFLRAYDWSAWLCCRYLHDFKVNKRLFKGLEEPVAYIGFPETSLMKWMPEGAEQRVENEKHLVLQLPEVMVSDTPENLSAATAPTPQPASSPHYDFFVFSCFLATYHLFACLSIGWQVARTVY